VAPSAVRHHASQVRSAAIDVPLLIKIGRRRRNWKLFVGGAGLL
jgi:hypothetical protein